MLIVTGTMPFVSATVEVGIGACDCPGRSWSFPASASILSDVFTHEEFIRCHWVDGAGWTPCVTNPAEYEALHWAFEDQKIPTFAEWMEGARAAAAAANEQSIEHWRRKFLLAVDWEIEQAKGQLVRAEKRIEHERRRLQLARCRAAAARIDDPALAAAAQRLLAEDWSGGPAELLATAAALLA